MLLLGTGEAGKSTFVKQMKILYGIGFTDEEKNTFRVDILNNVVDGIKTLIDGMDKLSIPYEVLIWKQLKHTTNNNYVCYIERLFIPCLGPTDSELCTPTTSWFIRFNNSGVYWTSLGRQRNTGLLWPTQCSSNSWFCQIFPWQH